MKNDDIEKHCQQWLSPNNRIGSDGNVCPKNIGTAPHRKKDHYHRIDTKIWSLFKPIASFGLKVLITGCEPDFFVSQCSELKPHFFRGYVLP